MLLIGIKNIIILNHKKMNRKIKFRAFQDNQMLKSPLNSNYGLQRFFGFLYEDAPVMRFTGLKDKNKAELYDGDLFTCETNKFIYRVWSVAGGFAINTHVEIWQNDIKKDYPQPSIPLADEQTVSWFESSCTIIGNIYENPDLI